MIHKEKLLEYLRFYTLRDFMINVHGLVKMIMDGKFDKKIVKENFHEHICFTCELYNPNNEHEVCPECTSNKFFRDYWRPMKVVECKDCQEILDNYGCMGCKKEVDKK